MAVRGVGCCAIQVPATWTLAKMGSRRPFRPKPAPYGAPVSFCHRPSPSRGADAHGVAQRAEMSRTMRSSRRCAERKERSTSINARDRSSLGPPTHASADPLTRSIINSSEEATEARSAAVLMVGCLAPVA